MFTIRDLTWNYGTLWTASFPKRCVRSLKNEWMILVHFYLRWPPRYRASWCPGAVWLILCWPDVLVRGLQHMHAHLINFLLIFTCSIHSGCSGLFIHPILGPLLFSKICKLFVTAYMWCIGRSNSMQITQPYRVPVTTMRICQTVGMQTLQEGRVCTVKWDEAKTMILLLIVEKRGAKSWKMW